ncbi:MAG: GNAT family N-acetyltransferase [Solibacillus sp.]
MIIKELTTLQEMEQVQQLEECVWGISPIPTHQTLTAVKNGGIVVGAFDGEKLVGFSYGFPALKNGQSYLCSHMLGIDEAYRSQRIGEQLKHEQRQIARAKGYNMMHWTFDPLETRNGYLNLTKLNGICDTYLENCYGEMQDGFNKGLPSDRFEVHWHLASDYVEQQQQPEIVNLRPIGQFSIDQNDLPILQLANLENLTNDSYSLPVPKDFQQLKQTSADCAMHWRMMTRKAFVALFSQGYVAVRIAIGEQWNDYIFMKKETLALGGNTYENY